MLFILTTWSSFPVILVKIWFEISKSYREFKKKSTLVENCRLVRATLGQIYLITKLSKVWPLQQYILPKTWALGQPRVSELVLGPNKLSLFPLHISCATTYVAQTYVPEEYINYLPKMASSLKLFWVFQVCLHQSLTRFYLITKFSKIWPVQQYKHGSTLS